MPATMAWHDFTDMTLARVCEQAGSPSPTAAGCSRPAVDGHGLRRARSFRQQRLCAISLDNAPTGRGLVCAAGLFLAAGIDDVGEFILGGELRQDHTHG